MAAPVGPRVPTILPPALLSARAPSEPTVKLGTSDGLRPPTERPAEKSRPRGRPTKAQLAKEARAITSDVIRTFVEENPSKKDVADYLRSRISELSDLTI